MRKQACSLAEAEPLMRQILEEGGVFSFYPRGTSMEPMIREGRDMVALKPLPPKLQKYQAVLYKRKNGAFVLHRIVRIKDDSYMMRGDNQYVSEPGIRREQIIGIVCEIKNEKRKIDTESFWYRVKIAIWVETAFMRRCVKGVLRWLLKGEQR